MEFLTILAEGGTILAAALLPVAIIGALTLGATQVLKMFIPKGTTPEQKLEYKKKVQKLSIVIAIFLAFATDASMLKPFGFTPADTLCIIFPSMATIMAVIYSVVFFLADLGLVGLLSGRVSNAVFDYLKNKQKSSDALLNSSPPG